MSTVSLPQDLQDKLNIAESKLAEAAVKDEDAAVAAHTLLEAQDADAMARDAALAAHQDANVVATDAVNAIMVHFGLKAA